MAMKKPRILIHPLFFLLFLFLFSSENKGEPLLFLLAVLLHESGHLFAIFFFGYPLDCLILTPVGAKICFHQPWIPYRREIRLYLCGPFANFLGCAVALIWVRIRMSREGLFFFFCNLLLALLNLLPIRGLDGERALFAFICLKGEEGTAYRVGTAVSLALLALLTMGGIFLWQREQNPTLLFFSLSLLGEHLPKRQKKKAAMLS